MAKSDEFAVDLFKSDRLLVLLKPNRHEPYYGSHQ